MREREREQKHPTIRQQKTAFVDGSMYKVKMNVYMNVYIDVHEIKLINTQPYGRKVTAFLHGSTITRTLYYQKKQFFLVVQKNLWS
jgi:hypothetical protein